VQKLINDPAALVDEALDGLLAVHAHAWKAGPYPRTLVRADAPVAGKVGIVTGGGFGHLPLFLGYVGRGLVDGCAVGNVFSSPPAEAVLALTRAVNGGAGVLHLIGNYTGDTLNFSLAQEDAEAEGIRVVQVAGTDDVASAPRGERTRRRGVAGLFFAYKLAGAAAEAGRDLEGVAEVARQAIARTASMGVGLSPCIIPAAGAPNFTLAEGEMEVGIGIHGEPGVRRGPLQPADAVADQLTEAVTADLELSAGAQVAVLINGLGATPREELYLLARRVLDRLKARRITVRRTYVGEYVTSLEMAGASLSVLHLDPDLEPLLLAPAVSPMFVQTDAAWVAG
jgi:dihydroxyacetone kinase